MSHSLSHIHTCTHKKVPGEIRHGSLFVLSHFYLPQPHIELRTAQFRETTSTFFMHVDPWLWPSKFLWDFQWQEPVLASPSHLHGRTVPWCSLMGRFGDGQVCLHCASLQAGPECQCLSAALSKVQLSATVWPIRSWVMLMLCSGTHMG